MHRVTAEDERRGENHAAKHRQAKQDCEALARDGRRIRLRTDCPRCGEVLKPCAATAHPEMIEPAMKAADPAPRAQPYSKPRGLSRRDATNARASARVVVGATAKA